MAQRRLRWQPVDWAEYVNDPALLLCSMAAQAAWPRITSLCWYAEPRGHMLIEGRPPSVEDLAVLWRMDPAVLPPVFAELVSRGKLERTERGVFVHPRMVADEARRQAAETLPDPVTIRAIADEATAILASRADRLAKQRARQARYRNRKKAAAVLGQMRALAVMERANVSMGDVTTPQEVTSPSSEVTSPISFENRDLHAFPAESESRAREEQGSEGPMAMQPGFVRMDDWRGLRRKRRA